MPWPTKTISQWLPYKTYSTAVASQTCIRANIICRGHWWTPLLSTIHSLFTNIPWQKYFRLAPGLLRSLRSEHGDCPVQYGKPNREGCAWSLELRSVLVLHACLCRYCRISWPVATGGRSYSLRTASNKHTVLPLFRPSVPVVPALCCPRHTATRIDDQVYGQMRPNVNATA